jgi:hypothetical protein
MDFRFEGHFFGHLRKHQKMRHRPQKCKNSCGEVQISKKSCGRINVHFDRHKKRVKEMYIFHQIFHRKNWNAQPVMPRLYHPHGYYITVDNSDNSARRSMLQFEDLSHPTFNRHIHATK